MRKLKRSLALLVALVMCLSLLPANGWFAAEATAEEAGGAASSVYEPWAHGYRFVDILNWSPETDDYAEELVAQVPLQERIGTYAATQANPWLSDEPELYAISSSNYRNTDTSNGPWNGALAYDEFGFNVFKFWQYTNYVGAGGRPTEHIDTATKAFVGNFEYGTIAIPIAAATNAAHKNGVLSLAEYFTPRTPQYTEEWLYQDENGDFPYARKLVEIAEYYGFDGYFINQEEYIPGEYVPLFRDMIKWMVDEGMYIQWYDSIGDAGGISYQNAFNDYNDGWLWNSEDGNVANSIFLNYWYSSSALKNSKAHAESLGLDPYDTVFMGVEGGQWKFGTDIESRYNCVDENGQPYTSFAIWGSDWYQDQYDRTDNNRYKAEYQWSVEERERMYFTSAAENAGTYSVGQVTRDDVGAGTISFQGFSKYVVEKSVIDGTVFASDFNNGHGMQYFRNGEVARDLEWSNLNLQDVLPTWQWWIETEGEALTLDMDWDYGPEFSRVQGAFPYTQVGAYNGGSSLVIYGDLADKHTVNLYKTELDVVEGSAIALTYHKTSADDASQIGVAVSFQTDDGGVETVVLPIENSGAQTGWTTAAVDLSAYAGRTIAAIGLELSAAEAVTGYQINLGRLVVTDGTDYTPAAPENVVLDKFFDGTGEIQLKWALAAYDTVRNYHIYAVYADGTERFVGGAYADSYYIQTLENADAVVALEVRAVGIDGSESEGARVAINAGIKVSDVKAVSADNVLTVTWNEPDGVAAVEVAMEFFYSEEVAPAAVTVDAGVGTASFDIAVQDGQKYILSLTAIDAAGNAGETVNYFGVLADTYSAPFDGEPRVEDSGVINFTTPTAGDWFSLTMVINGNSRSFTRFGGSAMERISVGSSGLSTVVITVTDIDGNVSEPVTIMFMDGYPADLSQEYGAERFPDAALLAALHALVGPTLEDLMSFRGELDLSNLGITDLTGLSALAGLTELDLSGNPLTALNAKLLPSGLEKLVLDDCEALERIELDGRTALEVVLGDLSALTYLSLNGYGAYDLDLSGCPALTDLYLDGAKLTALDITENTKLHNFTIIGSEIATLTAADAASYTDAYYWAWSSSKLDLSETTAEGAFFAGMKDYFANAGLEEEIGSTPVVILDGTTNNSAAEFDCWYDTTKTFDLGKVFLLSDITMRTRQASSYGVLSEFILSVSTDGETFTELAHPTDATENYTVEVPAGTRARYIKIVDVQDTEAWTYWTVTAYDVAPMGFTYGGQKPAMEKDPIPSMSVYADGADYQLLDLLDAWYASAHTVAGGTYAADLAAADWINADYLAAQSVRPSGVKVTITDSQGGIYSFPTEGPVLGSIEAEPLSVTNIYASGFYTGETPEMMFDGSPTSKWCTGSNGAWTVFELEDARVLGQWYTMHAGIESNSMITSAYRLQVLDTDVLTEEEYLAMNESGKRSAAGSAGNWKDLVVVTGNTENEVTIELPMDDLVTAQVYRFVVDQYVQPGAQYGAVRIYEMALYAYEGALGADINGMLKADKPETYTVTYQKAGVELNRTTVTVEEIPEVIVASGWSGYTTWRLNDQGVLTVTPTDQTFEGETNMKNYWKVNGVLTLPWSDYADAVTKVVIEEGVHDIGQMAFYELPNLTEVVLPDSAVEIRNYAFKNCQKLTTINLEVVEYIREGAFYGCSALENVAFAESVVIEDWAFSRTPVVLP